MLDLSDDEGDEAMEDVGAAKTAEEKAQQQFQLVESFGSEKQKRLLASARQSKVDGADLDSSLTNSLSMVDPQCKIIIKNVTPQITFTLFLLNCCLIKHQLVGHLLSLLIVLHSVLLAICRL